LTSYREATCTKSCHLGATPIGGGAPPRRRVLTALGATALAAAFDVRPGSLLAQDSSSRIARIIVPFAPGAAVDVIARMLAGPLSAQWGKSVVVENRPGGRTLIAAEVVARSEPDGDTLFFCLDDTFTIVPHLSKPGTFDPMKELAPLNLVGTIPMAFVVNPSLPVDSIAALIDYAHSNPTALSYGSSGLGSLPHLAMEMLKSQAQINMVHVPYRGLAPVQTAVIAGEVQAGILGFGTSRNMIDAGRLRAIAIASPERVKSSSNIPTTGEAGFPRVDATSRLTLAGPMKMSAETMGRVNAAVSRALNRPDIRKQFEARDIVLTNLGPKPLEEIERISRANAEAVRISGAQAE
jgi:tripartite-type tricarboxylate transporter receptor subunit TctC